MSKANTDEKPNPQCVVVVTEGGYWGKGEDLEDAIAKAYDAGERGAKSSVIYIYTGPKEKLDEIGCTSYGDIAYSLECTSNRVGKVNLRYKKEKK